MIGRPVARFLNEVSPQIEAFVAELAVEALDESVCTGLPGSMKRSQTPCPGETRSLFWKFQGHRQQAARIGNWKYYKLEDNEFLFDLSVDTMERANKIMEASKTADHLRNAWADWNKGMVTDDSIQGFCHDPGSLAGMLSTGEGSNCKTYGPAPFPDI